MNLEELRKLADSFFEWPTEDRTQVTLTSALLFAQHVLRVDHARAAPVDDDDVLSDAIDNLIHDNYERSQCGSRNREADANLIRAALASRKREEQGYE